MTEEASVLRAQLGSMQKRFDSPTRSAADGRRAASRRGRRDHHDDAAG